MESRYLYRSALARHWPIVQDRNDYVIENDDPAIWYVTSAYFDALSDFDPHDVNQRAHETAVEEGWWFCLPIDESTSSALRVVVNVPLTVAEEACFASGRWPLLRVPCGALLIGECSFGVSRLEEVNGSDIISVQHHDRNAVVLVPPGNYAVNILQYLSGPNFCFHLTPASDEPPCPMNMALTLHESVPRKLQDRVVGTWQTDQPGAVRPAHLCGSDPVAVRNWGLSYLEPIFDCRESIPRLQVRLS